jgi:hypothetical protein
VKTLLQTHSVYDEPQMRSLGIELEVLGEEPQPERSLMRQAAVQCSAGPHKLNK